LQSYQHRQYVDCWWWRFLQPDLAKHQWEHTGNLDQYRQQSGTRARRRSQLPR
jgi:hypothetical protein